MEKIFSCRFFPPTAFWSHPEHIQRERLSVCVHSLFTGGNVSLALRFQGKIIFRKAQTQAFTWIGNKFRESAPPNESAIE